MAELIRRILIVDDDVDKRFNYVTAVLGDGNHGPIRPMVSTATSTDEGHKALEDARSRGEPFHVLVADLYLPGFEDGVWLIQQLRTAGYTPDDLDVVLLSSQMESADKTVEEAIAEATRTWCGREVDSVTQILRPSVDDESEFHEAVWRGIWDRVDESYRRTVSSVGDKYAVDSGYLTANQQLQARLKLLFEKEAPSMLPVLITGETGTGKEVVAREIHRHSSRAKREFCVVNCAAISESLAETELFGHERGAFTGAVRRRDGLFLRADGGTVFLDEIGDLPLTQQAMLLRCLEEGKVQRVGGDTWEPFDARIITATNLDLERGMTEGSFREDLFRRISVCTVELSPLRERREDIRPLVQHFWRVCEPKRTEKWHPDTYRYIESYEWPGNVRQLEHTIQHLKVVTDVGTPIIRAAFDMVLKGTDRLDGLESLDSFTARKQHAVFYPSLIEMVSESEQVAAPADRLCRRIWEEHGLWFGNNEGEGAKRIRNAWEYHYNQCETCSKLWKGRFGRSMIRNRVS